MVNKVPVTVRRMPLLRRTRKNSILSLAKKLDEDITKLLDDNANLSVTKAAVFCAMDYLDEYRKSTGSAENMRSQIQDYIRGIFTAQSWRKIRSKQRSRCCGW